MKTSIYPALFLFLALVAAIQDSCIMRSVTGSNRLTAGGHNTSILPKSAEPEWFRGEIWFQSEVPSPATMMSLMTSTQETQSVETSASSFDTALFSKQVGGTANNTLLLSAPTIVLSASPAATTVLDRDDVTVRTVTITKTSTISSFMAPGIANSPKNLQMTGNPTDHMTIAIRNMYTSQFSLSFGSDAGGPTPYGNPSATVLPVKSSTQYMFPTGWAGRIYVGPNLNPYGSKIEGSFTGPPDIDVSYVDGYSVPITCSSNGKSVAGCNIELFRQPGFKCDDEVSGPVCLNSAQNVPDGPAPGFFAACSGAAYTYPNDNEANMSNLNSTLISCCIGTACEAPSRQKQSENNGRRSLKPARLYSRKRKASRNLLRLRSRRYHRHLRRLNIGA